MLRSSLLNFQAYTVFMPTQGGHKIGEKNSMSFPGFSRAINLLFHRLLQQKINVIMTFIKGHDDPVYPVNSCFTQISQWRTKNTLFVCCNFPWGCTEFTEFPENFLSFPCSEKSLSIPGFPGLWPPCNNDDDDDDDDDGGGGDDGNIVLAVVVVVVRRHLCELGVSTPTFPLPV